MHQYVSLARSLSLSHTQTHTHIYTPHTEEYYSAMRKKEALPFTTDGSLGFPGGASGRESTFRCRRHETQVQSLCWEDPLEEGMAAHSSMLAWRTHGQRSLAGYSPGVTQSQTRLTQLSMCAHTHGSLWHHAKRNKSAEKEKHRMISFKCGSNNNKKIQTYRKREQNGGDQERGWGKREDVGQSTNFRL